MKGIAPAGAAVALLFVISTAANASVVVDIDQAGANVVATVSGTLNLSGLTEDGTDLLVMAVESSYAYIGNGTGDDVVDGYYGFTGPANFGSTTGLAVLPNSASGADFALNGSFFTVPFVFVDPNYSGGSLAGTETFDGTTLAGLDLVTGTYTYTLPDDTITVNIGNAVAGVPEPATLALFALGLVGVGMSRRRLVS